MTPAEETQFAEIEVDTEVLEASPASMILMHKLRLLFGLVSITSMFHLTAFKTDKIKLNVIVLHFYHCFGLSVLNMLISNEVWKKHKLHFHFK